MTGQRPVFRVAATVALDRALRQLHDDGRRVPCERGRADLWFSTNADDQARAVAICRTCPVAQLCGAAGAALGAEGVWGVPCAA